MPPLPFSTSSVSSTSGGGWPSEQQIAEPEVNTISAPARSDLLWLAVDLDGTLAQDVWSPTTYKNPIGPPIPGNLVKLQAAVAQGYKIVIHTARPSSDYEAIETWLLEHGIPFRSIVTGKVLAYRYVDDRAINADAERWY